MIEATIRGKRILVRNVPFKDKDVTIKRIHGCKGEYDETVRPKEWMGWSLPLTMASCHALRQTFGRNLKVGNDLSDWARAELKKQSALEEIRSGTAAELSSIASRYPEMHQAMMARSYQPVGTSFIVHGQFVILGDDPGLGKTVQTLGALVEKGCKRILVCCPKTTARPVWCDETNFWTPGIKPFVAQGNHQQREDMIKAFEYWPDGPKMLIINTEMIRAGKRWKCPDGTVWKVEPGTIYKRRPHPDTCHDDHGLESISKAHKKFVSYTWPQLFSREWDAVVMDESHQFLASTKNIQSKNITQGRLGAVHLRRRVKATGIAAALSGTPFRSDLRKAWGTLNWLWPNVFTSFHGWAQGHFDYEEDDGKGYGFQPEYKRVPRDIARFNAELRPYMLAREKGTVASDLPPVQFMGTRPRDNMVDGLKAIWLELTPEQEKAYRQMEDLSEAEVEGGTLMAMGTLSEITRKRQLATSYGRMEGRAFVPTLPSNKIEWLLEFLEEYGDRDGKVIYGSEFTQVVDLAADVIQKELGLEVLKITGAVTGRKRELAVTRFQDVDDPCKIIGLNLSAGGVGITLDAADYVIELDQPWTSDKEKQFIDRAHRVSRVHNVFVYRLMSLGTVDEWMGTLTDEQRRILMSASPAAIEMQREAIRA
jgi:SNF2 family DNA or RNA helicase